MLKVILDYPNLEMVKAAKKRQLAFWLKYLPSPGMETFADEDDWSNVHSAIDSETAILQQIISCFHATGGYTQEIREEFGDLPRLEE